MSLFLQKLNEHFGQHTTPDGQDVAELVADYLAVTGIDASYTYVDEDDEQEGIHDDCYMVQHHSSNRNVFFDANNGAIYKSGIVSRGMILDYVYRGICHLLNFTTLYVFDSYGVGEREELLDVLNSDWAANTIIGNHLVYLFNLRSAHPIYKKDLPSHWAWAYPEETGLANKFLYNTATPTVRNGGVLFYPLALGMESCRENLPALLTGILPCTFDQAPKGEAPCSILNYSTRVESILDVKIKPGETLFGIELELDKVDESKLSKAHDILKKHCIFKRDGSVSNGVEIVSKPDTIANHKEVFKKFIVDGKSAGLVANSNCGIHIHVSRGHMSFLTLGRINAFMNINREKVEEIAGRSSSYAKFSQNNYDKGLLNPWYQASGDRYAKDKKFSWDKYTCLNLAPAHTMEFRIFKSTTDWEEFCRFLEFTEAVVNYCCLAGNDNKGKISNMKDLMAFKNFAAFVAARGSIFPSLNKFIKKEFA